MPAAPVGWPATPALIAEAVGSHGHPLVVGAGPADTGRILFGL